MLKMVAIVISVWSGQADSFTYPERYVSVAQCQGAIEATTDELLQFLKDHYGIDADDVRVQLRCEGA